MKKLPKEQLFFNFTKNNQNNDLIVTQYGYENFKEKSGEPFPFIRNTYLLHYVISGSGFVVINKKIFTASAGDFFFLPSDTLIHYYPNKDDPWSYYWIDLVGLQLKSYYNRMQFSIDNPIYHCQNTAIIEDCFSKILNCHKQQNTEELMLLSYTYRIFAQIIKERVPLYTKTITNTEKYISLTLDYIQKNLASPTLSLQEIANNLFIHPVYLSKIFKEKTGYNISKYIISTRLKHSTLLLKNLSYSINEISKIVGYSNQLYFSKEFKRQYNMTPSEYRKINNTKKPIE